ncbi:hypothetical protein EZV62_027702 [Acer yangbiense]|uniref:Leucine-rich repeat-containing N-terminal plant-type domain-containing protein n=1 Tax=Acer yangbiense TaxID=1000413 RepID=A0A5C7GUK5_9ROSI|nr:hypothetical protein EZV62_027702 [Acer yangbiense]
MEKISHLNLDMDKEVIESIPLSYKKRPDNLVWHSDKKGVYQVALCEKLKNLGSTSHQDRRWWSVLRNLHIPRKIKVFIWRVCNNVVPSLANLYRRKIVEDLRCKRLRSASEILDWSANFLLGFQDTKAKCSRRESQINWSPPPPRSLKLNSNHIGVGVVIRDWEGKVVVALSKSLPGRILSPYKGLAISRPSERTFTPLGHNNERSALLQFKETFLIINSTYCSSVHLKTASWNLEENSECCSWDGVYCNENTGYVIELYLWNSCVRFNLL